MAVAHLMTTVSRLTGNMLTGDRGRRVTDRMGGTEPGDLGSPLVEIRLKSGRTRQADFVNCPPYNPLIKIP